MPIAIESGEHRVGAPAQHVPSRPTMIITPGRIAYFGLLGRPKLRIFGGWAVYLSIGAPITTRIGGEHNQSFFGVIEPYVPHTIETTDRFVIEVVIEAETVDPSHPLLSFQHLDVAEAAERICRAFQQTSLKVPDCTSFDQLFFGQSLPKRRLDPRIERIIRQIQQSPADSHSAEDYARQCNLSNSRFTHLFREQTNTTLRRFCAWKRARAVMNFVKNDEPLVNTALSAGFADSTHLSHSIRFFFGLRPKDIMAGSRNLNLVCDKPRLATRI
ncbi:MAG: helix-turn-helix domain-containing protein [Dehalococcoidia bacterium]